MPLLKFVLGIHIHLYVCTYIHFDSRICIDNMFVVYTYICMYIMGNDSTKNCSHVYFKMK